MTAAGDAVLEAKGLSKSFMTGGRRVAALTEVSCRVRSGMVTGLIGSDGAGKTTLMRLAAGLLAPDAGNIAVLGRDATHHSLAVQASIGYMPQRFGLYEDLTVQENLDLYADLQAVPVAARPARYAELIHMAGLAPFTARLAGQLSGGMKQKLGLACTLVRQPPLLILDEPTVGVDPLSRRELWAIIHRLVREQKTSVLLSTAYLDEAEHCDEVILLHEGRLLQQGIPTSFSDPMRGRVYALAAEDAGPRFLQPVVARSPGVIDALVQGSQVRVVMEPGQAPDPAAWLGAAKNVTVIPLSPRFEDGFIAMLKSDRPEHAWQGPAESGLAPVGRGGGDAAAIEVRQVERRFGSFFAVKNLSFSVARGEVFGLLGANGAGKTTTFRMLCGLLPPSGGTLRVAGIDLRHAGAAVRARIGYMSQKFSLYGHLSVAENLQFFSSVYGLSGNRGRNRVAWAMEAFGLDVLSRAISADLALGYKQRLALACALMHEPEILFLDEPTSGVDPLARREFWRRINELATQGVTVMVTTHFMEEAEYCDRLALMAAGEMLTIGTPAGIRAEARTAELPEPTLEDAVVGLIQAGAAA